MRYQVFERGLLRSVESAKRDGAYYETDNLDEALDCLQDILDFGLTGFVMDSKTGDIFDYDWRK